MPANRNSIHQIPESERLRVVEELLKDPRSPVPWEVARSLTREQKLDYLANLLRHMMSFWEDSPEHNLKG